MQTKINLYQIQKNSIFAYILYKKNSSEDKENATDWNRKLLEELKSDEKLIKMGDENSDCCSGSDSNPSEDNLPDNVMNKILPPEIKKNKSPLKMAKMRKIINADNLNKKKADRNEEIKIADAKERISESVREKSPNKDIRASSPRSKIGQKLERANRSLAPAKQMQIISPAVKINSKRELFSAANDSRNEHQTASSNVPMVDAFTQTEKEDFQKAK